MRLEIGLPTLSRAFQLRGLALGPLPACHDGSLLGHCRLEPLLAGLLLRPERVQLGPALAQLGGRLAELALVQLRLVLELP